MAGFQDPNQKRKEEIMKLLKQQQQLEEYQKSKSDILNSANKVRKNIGSLGKTLSKSNNATLSNIGNKMYDYSGQRLLDQSKQNALNTAKQGFNSLKTKLGFGGSAGASAGAVNSAGAGTAGNVIGSQFANPALSSALTSATTTGASSAGTGSALGGAIASQAPSAAATTGAGLSAGAGATAAGSAASGAAASGAAAGATAGSGAAAGAAGAASTIPVAGWIAAAAILAANAFKSINDKKKIKAMQLSAQEAQKGQQEALTAKSNAMQNLEQQKEELNAIKDEKTKEDALKAQTTNEILQAVTGNQIQHDSMPVNKSLSSTDINTPTEQQTLDNELPVSSDNGIDIAGMINSALSQNNEGEMTGGAAYLAPAFNEGKLDTETPTNPSYLPWEQRKDIPMLKPLTPEEEGVWQAREKMKFARKQEDALSKQNTSFAPQQTSNQTNRENPFALPQKKEFDESQFEIIEPPSFVPINQNSSSTAPSTQNLSIEQKVNEALAKTETPNVQATTPLVEEKTEQPVETETPFVPDGSKESVIADILNKIKAGYKENRENGFKPENLLKDENKTGWTKFGEALGTTGRVLSNPYTQGLIAGTVAGVRNHDFGDGLEYGVNWAKNKAMSDYYQKQLTGKDVAGVLGGYGADDYKAQYYGLNANSAIAKRNYDMLGNAKKTDAYTKNIDSQIEHRNKNSDREDAKLAIQLHNSELADNKFLLELDKFAETKRSNSANEELKRLRIEQTNARKSGSMSGEINIVKARFKEQKALLDNLLPASTEEEIAYKNQQLMSIHSEYQRSLREIEEHYKYQQPQYANTVATLDEFDDMSNDTLLDDPELPDYIPTI